MSVLDGWKDEVLLVIREHIKPWSFDRKNTKESFHAWRDAMEKKDKQQVVQCLSDIIVRLNEHIEKTIRGCKPVRSRKIAQKRHATTFSRKRSKANALGKNREVTLERVIVSAMHGYQDEEWYNQFNVASGIGGPNSDRKTSIDIIRFDPKNKGWTFIELKDWKAKDSPLRVLYEIILYGILFSQIRRYSVELRLHNEVQEIKNVRLAAMAPHTWHEQFKADSKHLLSPDSIFELASCALRSAQSKDPFLMHGMMIEPYVYTLRGIKHTELSALKDDHDRIRRWVQNSFCPENS